MTAPAMMAPVVMEMQRQPTMMQITVPQGVGPGMTFQVQTASGQIVPVTCPHGVMAGQVVQIPQQ